MSTRAFSTPAAGDPVARASARPRLHLLIAISLLVPLAGLAQTIDVSNEGYDPMRQITAQQMHPNVLLVLDRSGSLGFPIEFANTTYSTESTCGFTSTRNWGYDCSSRAVAGWYFNFASGISGYAAIAGDYSLNLSSATCTPRTGLGHGYWLPPEL